MTSEREPGAGGELALIGLGLDELSVTAGQVARVKHAVRQLNAAECREMAEAVMCHGCMANGLEKTRAIAMAKYPELLE